MTRAKTLATLLLLPLAFSLSAAPQTKPEAKVEERPDDMEFGLRKKDDGPLVVAKGPTKKVEGKFQNGMKLYLMTDKRLIGEVTAYRPSHLFPDGKTREAVRLKLADGKNTWLPADTARRIYVTQ